ncbi:MAG: hypothetical protein IEMM0008_1483 [bacterium]|nr:MAG: hypothetical protein IEMM0008_1483 [bacterium]
MLKSNGRFFVVLSIFSRAFIIVFICLVALWNVYLNLKVAYNLPRLVELHYGKEIVKIGSYSMTINKGKIVRQFYETSDDFFSLFGDPISVMQTNSGMIWSIQVFNIPITDPIAALSVLVRNHSIELGFALGLILPILLALVFGRVFCSYFCPASLLFFVAARIRRMLARYFYLPQIKLSTGVSWGLFFGGLAAAYIYGYGIWTFILPYFSMNQTLFQGLALGTLSVAVGSIILFVLLDFVLGQQFTCCYICPTGRLLGFIGTKSYISIKRNQPLCLDHCHSCAEICPMEVNPKLDETLNCSLCGECMVVCPSHCLSFGHK